MTVKITSRPRVVIVGAGFAGLSAARGLAHCPADVLILDRNNYHTFHALLYQVAAAELEPEAISYPVRSIIRKMPNINFKMAEANAFDLGSQAVRTTDSTIPYDILVIATGSAPRFFGVPGAEENTFGLKTLEEAIALRNHILCCLEQVIAEPDAERREEFLNFAIIGGGPTGVELAGAFVELIKGPVAKDYPMLDPDEAGILLLEATDHLLPGLPRRLGDYALERLRQMGVRVALRSAVARVLPDRISLADGREIRAATSVWTAGVRGDPLAEASGLPMAGDGRVLVLPTLQVPGHPEVFVIGDLAYAEKDGHPLPFVAPVAIQQGAAVAQNIKRLIAGLDPVPFQYRYKGSMATIGRMAAVAHIGGRSFTGLAAWFLWLMVHVVSLIGFRNRLLVMVNWAWDFVLYERAVRLILPSETCTATRERVASGKPD